MLSMEYILTVSCTVLQNAFAMLGDAAADYFQSGNSDDRRAWERVRLDGKVCIVTGGNAGIGFATSQRLAGMGAHVILACRSKERGEAAAQAIRTAAGTRDPSARNDGKTTLNVEAMELDLSSSSSVRAFVQTFNQRNIPMHLLICNAGIMSPPARLASEGLELQFKVNYLSHWELAVGLLDHQRRLRESACGKPKATPSGQSSFFCLEEQGTRVVTLSSCTHTAGALQWSDKQSESFYSPFVSYAFTKLAAILMAKELTRRFDSNPILTGKYTAVAVHPGVVDTFLAHNFLDSQGKAWLGATGALILNMYSAFKKAAFDPLMRSPSNAASTLLFAALAPAELVAGQYVKPPRTVVANPFKSVADTGRSKELWEYSERLTGICAGDTLL
ncbi:hypothetical protein CEUSTIGMA_g2963.t1 [Chlamydomonas eustigma]|uniref:Uncharacterized protein n=1 Tax=Chlamydomonas eustigma TaxID=1157962 RepID=A0A250WYD9_9CHLO|nr:hypothetical protein CEUSTIGMA_g2963.t1 [Chlamydomonas eustigma]|eukprot:GAX75520.1 hypothetical protein CEUSTIGMA_g2963.t1 [Chlamydomonas eustigma]